MFNSILAPENSIALLRAEMDGKDVAVIVGLHGEIDDVVLITPIAVLVDDQLLERLTHEGVPVGLAKEIPVVGVD